MRGKRRPTPAGERALRIIPAHAGQTNASPLKRCPKPDHPRACGANQQRAGEAQLACGSSPRMRGKRHPPSPCNPVMRIIPAHAGQTVSNSSRTSARSDHPRACGANLTADDAHASTAGSSPRMRGKHLFDAFRVRGGRIIPAHAGQTRLSVVTRIVWADHPRACGANLHTVTPRSNMPGSSPRMRGKPGRGRPIRARIRIIPAHAGQTSLLTVAVNPLPDHPRACGAN